MGCSVQPNEPSCGDAVSVQHCTLNSIFSKDYEAPVVHGGGLAWAAIMLQICNLPMLRWISWSWALFDSLNKPL